MKIKIEIMDDNGKVLFYKIGEPPGFAWIGPAIVEEKEDKTILLYAFYFNATIGERLKS
jgi:hypothetical protein